jgi:hypothetical protein
MNTIITVDDKSYLTVTRKDRWDRAWKLVCLDEEYDKDHPERLTNASIAEATAVSMNLVRKMRRVYHRCRAEEPLQNPINWSWETVKDGTPSDHHYA